MRLPKHVTRPWPVPTTWRECRRATHRAVYVKLPSGLVTGELLWWLRDVDHGWYSYVHWQDQRTQTLYTEPVPAERLSPFPLPGG